mmetsp:Transcript_4749/g.6169  ORF Transcript_4749/g.6169 Transcript_4749/m.6169 type:complete len:119 (-) Transcript_4749:1006-1362(-)
MRAAVDSIQRSFQAWIRLPLHWKALFSGQVFITACAMAYRAKLVNERKRDLDMEGDLLSKTQPAFFGSAATTKAQTGGSSDASASIFFKPTLGKSNLLNIGSNRNNTSNNEKEKNEKI